MNGTGNSRSPQTTKSDVEYMKKALPGIEEKLKPEGETKDLWGAVFDFLMFWPFGIENHKGVRDKIIADWVLILSEYPMWAIAQGMLDLKKSWDRSDRPPPAKVIEAVKMRLNRAERLYWFFKSRVIEAQAE